MDAKQVFIPLGHPNRPGTRLDKLLAIVIHYTANADPSMGAAATAQYFGRRFIAGKDPKETNGQAWGYGSAQVVADQNEIVLAMPPDELAWACGDSRIIHPDGTKSQQLFGIQVLLNRSNHFTTSIEICNNGDWAAAANNAMQWAGDYIKSLGLKVDLASSLDPQNAGAPQEGQVYVVRHFDVTGKTCPKPFIDDPAAWVNFVTLLAYIVNS